VPEPPEATKCEQALSICLIEKRSKKRAIKTADFGKKVGNFFEGQGWGLGLGRAAAGWVRAADGGFEVFVFGLLGLRTAWSKAVQLARR